MTKKWKDLRRRERYIREADRMDEVLRRTNERLEKEEKKDRERKD